jgi:hypothetical protein
LALTSLIRTSADCGLRIADCGSRIEGRRFAQAQQGFVRGQRDLVAGAARREFDGWIELPLIGFNAERQPAKGLGRAIRRRLFGAALADRGCGWL